METEKIPFFSRVKKAIFNFDEYHTFAVEKIRRAAIYYIILMLLFSLIIAIAVTYKASKTVSKVVGELETNVSDFRIENNELVVAEDEKVVFEEENYFFGMIIDSEGTDIENANYHYGIMLLKDKVAFNYAITEYFGISHMITYEELSSIYDLNNINKQSVIDYLNSEKMTNAYISFFIFTTICKFMGYSFVILFDVLLLAVIGALASRIFKLKIQFKLTFNMAVYAMTLSILLYVLYLAINMLTGFEVRYFRLAYDAISYIYMITAILMIKSDVIRQQMELMKIAEVQKQVKEEAEDEKEEEKKETTDNSEEKKEKKGKKETPKGEPEGSNA